MSRKLLLAPEKPVRDNTIGALLNESGRDSLLRNERLPSVRTRPETARDCGGGDC